MKDMENNKFIIFLLCFSLISSNSFSFAFASIYESKILPVPYYEQESDWGCAEACVKMALYYLGANSPYSTFNPDLSSLNMKKGIGTVMYNTPLPFWERGFRLVFQNRPLTLLNLKDNVDQGWLTIIMIWFNQYKVAQHSVVVIGYNSTGFFIHDPWYSYRSHEAFRQTGPASYISKEELAFLWDCEYPYWGTVIIKNVFSTPPIYSCTISASGISKELPITMDVDSKTKHYMLARETVLQFEIGSAHTITVESPVKGEQNDTVRVEYKCDYNRFSTKSWGETTQNRFLYYEDVDYYLRINSSYSDPKGEGWYNEGEVASIYVEPSVSLNTSIMGLKLGNLGAFATFEKWSGNIESKNHEISVTVNQPMMMNAIWKEDHSKPNMIMFFISGVFSAIIASISLIIVRKYRSR
ncbi:hypothetical protein A3K80_06885 [Candidatus Bathyarchaeota archaeon RBG_13_38_9]|nr:MAG: hypothetical protein A3K80_06885 [Candidatus Bathyarchaeota archaeon RBG_13_38_9]